MSEFPETTHHCTTYVEDYDHAAHTPCTCPVCGGFLTWDKTGEIPICNKCGAELAKVPHQVQYGWKCCKCSTVNQFKDNKCVKCGHSECIECVEPDYEEGSGKICALSGPRKDMKQAAKTSRGAKKNAKAWRAFL